MKTRYPTDQIYHRWAHQRDAHRITNGPNLSADGACLFSYAECIGIVTPDCTILSTYRWSATTSKHQAYAARAAVGRKVYLPCQFPRDGSLPHLAQMAREQAAITLRNIDHGNKARTINAKIRSQLDDITALLDWARTIDNHNGAPIVLTLADARALRDGLLVQDKQTRLDNHAGQLANTIAAANNITKNESWHGIDHVIERLQALPALVPSLRADYAIDQVTPPAYLAKLPAQARRLLPKLLTMRDARDAEMLRINADNVADWRAGNNPHLPRELPPMLRIEGDRIATSWGVSVPLSVAPALWQMVTLARANGIGCDDCGRAKVGDYTLDTVHPDGSITVGCHKIAYSELAGIARQLNYIQ